MSAYDSPSILDNLEEMESILAEMELEVQVAGGKEEPPSEYTSCIRVNGRPILPPLMTPERRKECLEWKEKAVKLETKMKEKRRERILATIQTYRPSSAIEVKRYRSAEAGRFLQSAAFGGSVDLEEKRDSVISSIDTVVENPKFRPEDSSTSDDAQSDAFDSPPPSRPRKGSYTLDQPSPQLVAYMKRSGKQVSRPIPPNSPVPAVAVAPSGKQQLGSYLEELARPPTASAEPVPAGKVAAAAAESEEKACQVELEDISAQMNPEPRGSASVVQPDELSLDVDRTSADVSNVNLSSAFPSLSPSVSLKVPQSLDDEPTPKPTRNENLLAEVDNSEGSATPVPADLGASSVEGAVAALAKKQQAEIERLIALQARERERMRATFKKQQDALIGQVLSQLSSNTKKAATPDKNRDSAKQRRSRSPVIPTVAMHLRPESRILPGGFSLPKEALTEENERRFCKLSALARGHLTRKLMKTRKVQSIIGSMRDAMTIALQLHHEARSDSRPVGGVTAQDVDLHRRLLQQLYRDSISFHDVFFEMTPKQQMALISVDRDAAGLQKDMNGNHAGAAADRKKRLSAATLVRLEQKEQIQKMLEEMPGNAMLVKGSQLFGRSSRPTSANSHLLSGARPTRKTRSLGARSGSSTSSVSHFHSSPRSVAAGCSARRKSPPRRRKERTRKKSAPATKPWR